MKQEERSQVSSLEFPLETLETKSKGKRGKERMKTRVEINKMETQKTKETNLFLMSTE